MKYDKKVLNLFRHFSPNSFGKTQKCLQFSSNNLLDNKKWWLYNISVSWWPLQLAKSYVWTEYFLLAWAANLHKQDGHIWKSFEKAGWTIIIIIINPSYLIKCSHSLWCCNKVSRPLRGGDALFVHVYNNTHPPNSGKPPTHTQNYSLQSTIYSCFSTNGRQYWYCTHC